LHARRRGATDDDDILPIPLARVESGHHDEAIGQRNARDGRLVRQARTSPRHEQQRGGDVINSPASRFDDPRYTMSQVTGLLVAIREGEAAAVDQLFHLLYDDLRKLAHARLRRSGSLTLLDTTSLVHESYLRLFHAGSLEANDKGQFMAYAARVMRSVVVDFVRRRSAERRGGDAVHVDLDEALSHVTDPREREVLRVHEALEELAAIDERLVRVVEMRYFAGMTEEEVAEALDRSRRSVARDWEKARLFLAATLA
jgi:RNA polymerase sigma factor (TIGR02999 family)